MLTSFTSKFSALCSASSGTVEYNVRMSQDTVAVCKEQEKKKLNTLASIVKATMPGAKAKFLFNTAFEGEHEGEKLPELLAIQSLAEKVHILE